MKTVLIYPFGRETEFLAKYCKNLVDLELVCLVGVQGWDNYKGVYNIEGKIIPIYYDFEKALKEISPDTVWFVDFQFGLNFETIYIPFIELAIEKNKEIIFNQKIENRYNATIQDKVISYRVFKNERTLKLNESELKQINTPVVFVSSIFRGLNKFLIQLELRKELLDLNLKILQIGTKEEAEILGFYHMPEFMFNKEIGEKEKIISFNHYVKMLEEIEKPDLIVIGIPGEMFPASTKYTENFGFLAMYCFTAISPDILIVSVSYDEYSNHDYEIISEQIRMRFGCKADYFILTNKRFMLFESEIYQESQYLTIDESDYKIDTRDNVYCMERNMKDLTNKILIQLLQYGKIKSI